MAGVLGARFRLTLIAGVVGLFGAFAQTTPAAAQAAFCNLPGGFVDPATGFCVNNQGGAFSAAALSSQSLSQVTQSVSQQSNTAVSQAVSDRRTEEQQRCPAGFQRVGGSCQRVTAPEQRAASPTRPAAKAAAAKGKQAPQRVIVS